MNQPPTTIDDSDLLRAWISEHDGEDFYFFGEYIARGMARILTARRTVLPTVPCECVPLPCRFLIPVVVPENFQGLALADVLVAHDEADDTFRITHAEADCGASESQ